MASYKVVILNLATTEERKELTPPNTTVDSVTVVKLSGGGVNPPELALGSGEMFPVYAGFAVDICPPELAGIFYRNASPGAGTIVLLVSYGGLAARSV